MKNRVLWPLVLIVGVLLGVVASRWLPGQWFGANSSAPSALGGAASVAPPAAKPQGVGVEVAPVQLVAMPRVVSAVGTLRSESAVMLRPEITGRIAEIRFEEGGRVKQGDLLVRLDDGVTRAQLQQAQANLALAQSQYRRSEQLTKEGFISGQARDEAFNQLKVQQAAVALAQAQLEKTAILAPFDGLIGLRQVSLGDYVSPGADLVPIESIDPLQVDFRVPESFVGALDPGMPISVEFDAMPGQSRQGQVKAISPQVDVGGRSVLLRADIPNADLALRPGMFARVRLQLTDAQALVIPETALQSAGAERYVFRLENGVVRRVVVEIGQRRAGTVEVVSGLAQGDQVVIAGLQKINDGTPVRVLPAAGNSAS